MAKNPEAMGRANVEETISADAPPFLPYSRQTVEQDDIDAVVRALRSDYLTTGPEVERFEAELARTVGAREAVAVTNGTAALHAACFAAGVTEGDQVIVPAITFLATANCARFLGAEPVFADVDPDTGMVTAEEVARHIGPKTRAVIPVHLGSGVFDVASLREITQRHGVAVIEDAAHALGARDGDSAIGACHAGSEMATFSFHAVKSITTGEGGAITCNEADLARRLRLFRNHGMERDASRFEAQTPGPWYYEQQLLGHNLRMTDIQAALGTSQLAKLSRFVGRRRELAARYDALLSELPQVVPAKPARQGTRSAHHLYPVLIPFRTLEIDRSDLMQRLRERGIGTQVHYIPLPMQPYYRARGARVQDFPGASRYYERVLSLPLFPAMSEHDVERVVATLAALLRELGVTGH